MVTSSGQREWNATWGDQGDPGSTRVYSGIATGSMNLTINQSTGLPEELTLHVSVTCQATAGRLSCLRVNGFQYRVSVNGTPWKVVNVPSSYYGNQNDTTVKFLIFVQNLQNKEQYQKKRHNVASFGQRSGVRYSKDDEN
jgi:hypothetical protein